MTSVVSPEAREPLRFFGKFSQLIPVQVNFGHQSHVLTRKAGGSQGDETTQIISRHVDLRKTEQGRCNCGQTSSIRRRS